MFDDIPQREKAKTFLYLGFLCCFVGGNRERWQVKIG